jgi:uracil phosphoribosyltransferase
MTENVTVVDHPLVQHKLALMRRRETTTAEFRTLLREISLLLAYEVTRDLPLTEVEIETPLAKMKGPKLEGKKMVLISILRAGNGLLEGMLDLVPSARVGHIGLYRDPETGAQTIKYVCLLAAPEGVKAIREAHPDVPIFTAAIDEHLNDHGYIVPGLGDAGDRLYGTK